VRLGVVILPELPWPDARVQWRRAEELGFDHAWTYDHLAWRSLRDAPWFGTVPTLYDGRFYSAKEARTYPGCIQRPRIPFAIAATGRRGMRLAAAHGDTWVTTGDRVAERPLPADAGVKVVREQMARLDEACVQAGPDPAALGRLVLTGPCLDGGLTSLDAFRHTIGV